MTKSKKYPAYQPIRFTSCIEDLECIHTLLDGALEFYECEKPGFKKTIDRIKNTKYLIKSAIDKAPTKDIKLKFNVMLIGNQINLINKIDRQNWYGSQIQIY
jgi:hypothetical protein